MTDGDKGIKKKVEDFEKRLEERALGINEVPPPYKQKFLKISKEEYGNDHGVTLKELIKVYEGIFPTGHEEIEGKIDILANEVNEIKKKLKEHLDSLKKKPDTPEGCIRSADGSKLIKKS